MQCAMKVDNASYSPVCGSKWRITGTIVLLLAATSVAFAQGAPTSTQGEANTAPFSLGKVFTFLFLTLGPFNVIGPFLAQSHGREPAFKRRLALGAFVIAMAALFVAATQGASTLKSWGISIGALELTAGVILFLVALQPVLAQYRLQERVQTASIDAATSVSDLAFSLAFPTIVTPNGIAVLILILTLRPAESLTILGVAAFVLALDLLAMLGAGLILKVPFITPALGIVGSVMGILQVALGVQAVADGLRLLGIVGARSG